MALSTSTRTVPVASPIRLQQPHIDISVNVEDLPIDIANQVKQLEREQPKLLRQLMVYAVTHKLVFDQLSTALPR